MNREKSIAYFGVGLGIIIGYLFFMISVSISIYYDVFNLKHSVIFSSIVVILSGFAYIVFGVINTRRNPKQRSKE